MKKISLAVALVCTLLCAFYACTSVKEPVCIRRGNGLISETAIFPDSIAHGDTIKALFKFTGFSGCSKFNGFQPLYATDVIYYHSAFISPNIIDEGCVCTQIVPSFEETYNYVPSDTGAYYFSYLLNNSILTEDTVYVY